MRVKEY